MTLRAEQPLPRRRLPVTSGQKAMLAASASLLIGTAGMLRWATAKLPAQIPMHWSGAGAPDRVGPPSELWTLWVTAAALAFVLGLLAFNLPASGQLNGMPPVPEHDRPRLRQVSRSLVLALQLVATLILCGLTLVSALQGLGGPNLIGLALLPLAAIPVLLGWFYFRASASPR